MKKVKVFYWIGQRNFGDMLNIDIPQKLFGIDSVLSSPEECEASFIGSLLDDFLYKGIFKFGCKYKRVYEKPPVKVWGTGFITKENCYVKRLFNLPETNFRRLDCYAIRGKESLKRIKKIYPKQKFDDVVVGDPGLLSSFLIKKNCEKKYKLGIIPHHIEMDMPIWNKINDYIKDSTIIRVDGNVIDTITKIAQCDLIISSSLHGLIVADSFNIPNMRVIASDLLIGGDYKFNDYYSAFDIDIHNKIMTNDLFNNKNILECISDNYKISSDRVNILKNSLLNSFPF